MENTCKALVIVLQYLGVDRTDESHTEDDDLRVVEDSAALLRAASDEEKAVLIRVAAELGLPDLPGQIGIDQT